METVPEVHQTISTVYLASATQCFRCSESTKFNCSQDSALCSKHVPVSHVQMLEAGDNQFRLDFANKFLIRNEEESSWSLLILGTDEAHFILTGNLNSKNCAHWADNNPHGVFASPLHDEKVTMWCIITSTFILGPYFFEEVTDGYLQTCTVTSARYLDMLTHYAILEL